MTTEARNILAAAERDGFTCHIVAAHARAERARRAAVDREIARDRSISRAQARRIHAVLGWRA